MESLNGLKNAEMGYCTPKWGTAGSLDGENKKNGIHRFKKFVEHISLLEKCTSGCGSVLSNDFNVNYNLEEIMMTFYEFPETFQQCISF